jgi:hypothetical protein
MNIIKNKVVSALLALAFLLIHQPSNASETYIWQADVGGLGNVVNQGTDIRQIPLYARLNNLSFRITNSNPDGLFYGIRFSEGFDTSPLSEDKRINVGFWLWDTSVGCIEVGNCNLVLFAEAPSQWSGKYPFSASKNTIRIYRVDQVKGKSAYDSELVDTGCPAPWWINPVPGYGVLYFQLSITCLGIPAEFYTYSFAGADIGIKPIPFNFIETTLVINPVWKLAKNSFEKNGGKAGLQKNFGLTNKEVAGQISDSLDTINEQIKNLQNELNKKFKLTCSKGNKIQNLFTNSSKCPAGSKLLKRVKLR